MAGETILGSILYLESSDKARSDDLKNRVENDYLLKKV